jgi:hypothetical protein
MNLLYLSSENAKAFGGNPCREAALKISIPKNWNANAMIYDVLTWTNAGDRSALACETLADAKKSAQQSRTLDNQTVKIADAFGTVQHWNRVVGSKSNRWVVRPVVNDVFLSPN